MASLNKYRIKTHVNRITGPKFLFAVEKRFLLFFWVNVMNDLNETEALELLRVMKKYNGSKAEREEERTRALRQLMGDEPL